MISDRKWPEQFWHGAPNDRDCSGLPTKGGMGKEKIDY
jgi:hypothetical protein